MKNITPPLTEGAHFANLFEVEELEQRLENAWYSVHGEEVTDRDTGETHLEVTVGD
jgi:hypothetical protein